MCIEIHWFVMLEQFLDIFASVFVPQMHFCGHENMSQSLSDMYTWPLHNFTSTVNKGCIFILV